MRMRLKWFINGVMQALRRFYILLFAISLHRDFFV